MTQVFTLFASCAGGLEPLIVQELAAMGYTDTHPGFRGVTIRNVDMNAIYRINYCSRLVSRVFLPLNTFRCYDARSLYNAALEIEWSKYIPKGATIAIDANVAHPQLTNSLFAAQVVKDAICDQLRDLRGERPSVDTKAPDVQLNLFIHSDRGVISFDTSGTPLHKRGYRQESVPAPLQESIAAALLTMAGYRGDEVLCDPCCGSGTLLIEAALMATHTPPGYLRTVWGFKRLPQYVESEWLKVKREEDAKRIPINSRKFFGIELNRAVAGAARRNLREAGFKDIEVIQGDFRDVELMVQPNFIIANPPHGNRIYEVESLKGLYRSLGDFMKQKALKPARGFIFVGGLELTKEVGLAATKRHVVNNSGIDSRLLEFDIY